MMHKMDRRNFLRLATGFFLARPALAGEAGGAGAAQRSFMEIYSFACPHCYQLHLQLGIWLPLNPQVRCYPVHIVSTPDDLKLAASAYAAAVLGKGDVYRDAFFRAIYEDNQQPDEHSMVAAAQSVGLDGVTFANTMQGQDVAELLGRSEAITQRFQVQATPTLVIDMQRARQPDKDPLAILQEEFGKT